MKEITINSKKIPVWIGDNEESIRVRVARIFETIPRYIEEIKDNTILIVEKLSTDESEIFSEFLEKNNIKNYGRDELLFKLWFRHFYDRMKENEVFIFSKMDYLDKIDADITGKLNIKKMADLIEEKELKKIMEEYIYMVKENAEIDRKNVDMLRKIEETPSVEKLSFKKDMSTLRIVTNIKELDRTMDNIFANLICLDHSPFIRYRYYKIYEDFNISIPETWTEEEDERNHITIRVFNQEDISFFKESFYTECNIFFNEGILKISIKDINYTMNVSQELVLERIYSVFSKIQDFHIVDKQEVFISGSLIYPNLKFNNYVMKDLVTNHPYFSKFLMMKESLKAKKKGNYYFIIGKNEIRCSILSKTDEEDDSSVKSLNKKSIGTRYVKVSIKDSFSFDLISDIIFIFSRLLTIYKTEKIEILKFYRIYDKKFAEDEEKPILIKEKYTLGDIVPELFVSNYSRTCPHPPKIVEYDAKSTEIEGESPLLFPKTPEEGTQQFYSCNNNEKYKYIGVMDNNLENKNNFKYIPCCFEKNQFGKNANSTTEYYKGVDRQRGKQQNILVTNKFSPEDEFSFLPDNLDDIFISMNRNYNYLRKGVSSSKYSFLECILQSNKEYRKKSKSEKKDEIKRELTKLSENVNISVVLQENPGETEESLRIYLDHLKDGNHYMDPRRWIRLLEEVYECKIYIFSRKKEEKDASIVIPYHKLFHLHYSSDYKNTIFIYEHYGSEKSTTFPRCEIIVKVARDESKYYTFDNTEKIQYLYKKLFNQYYYRINKRVLSLIPQYFLPNLKFISQVVDNYGKLRGLYTEDHILLFTNPLPPLYLPLFKGNLYESYSIDHIHSFINKYNGQEKNKDKIEIVSQTAGNFLTEVELSFLNITFNVKVIPTKFASRGSDGDRTALFKNVENIPSFSNKIDKILKIKRLSQIMTEFFIFLFSYWNRGDVITLENSLQKLRSFKDEKIKIENDLENESYIIPENSPISIDILRECNFLNDEGKFVVKNEDILRRLIYSIRLRLNNDIEKVRSYCEKKEIYNFYSEIKYYSNLAKGNRNIIVQNTDIFQNIDHNIYKKAQPMKENYFMINDTIYNGHPVFLKECEDIGTAEKTSFNWYNTEKDNEIVPRIYIYESKENVRKLVKNKKDKLNSEVMIYRNKKGEDEFIHTMALCKL